MFTHYLSKQLVNIPTEQICYMIIDNMHETEINRLIDTFDSHLNT